MLTDYLKAVEDATERVDRLTAALEELIYQSSLAPLVRALQVLRGVALVTAATIAAEIGDFRRFRTARQFMAYVGLIPSEDSSGGRVRRGAITKCGNRHVRRLLVEAALHYRYQPAMSVAIRVVGVSPCTTQIPPSPPKTVARRRFFESSLRPSLRPQPTA